MARRVNMAMRAEEGQGREREMKTKREQTEGKRIRKAHSRGLYGEMRGRVGSPGTGDTLGDGSAKMPQGSVHFSVLIGTTDRRLCLLLVMREMAFLVEGDQRTSSWETLASF